MSDNVYIGQKAKDLTVSPEFDGYSKVVINIDEDTYYEAGDDTGRTLTIDNPWGTQEMAENILASVQGFQYQPYEANTAQLDPASEIGDGVTINSLYGGVYKRSERFGSAFIVDVSAPQDEEIDHEIGYISTTQRQITRNNKETKAQFTVQAGLISAEVAARTAADEDINATLAVQAEAIDARVTKESDNSSSTFGWRLESDSWTVYSGSSSNTILKADKDGLSVTGTIKATAGSIGGFTIKNGYLSTNNQTFGGTNNTGIYIGPSGIQLGQGFKVDSAGNLYATSGTFTGTIYAGNISYGGEAGYMSGGGISSGTVTTTQTDSDINTSLSYADFSNGVFNGWNTAAYVNASSIYGRWLSCSTFMINNYIYSPRTITYLDANEEVSYATVLAVSGYDW